MYDLPKEITFDFLRDQELELLSFGPYTVTLYFGDGAHIQIEGPFEHMVAEQGTEPVTSTFPLSNSRLMRLLMERVTKVSAKHDGTLTLSFGNGDRLVIQGNIGPYESYNVTRPGHPLLVV